MFEKSVITGKIRYIQVRMKLRIYYPTYFRVAVRLQPFPCLNSYSFLPKNVFKVTMYRNHQQKCKICTHKGHYLAIGWAVLHEISYFSTLQWAQTEFTLKSYIPARIVWESRPPFKENLVDQ